MALTLEKIDAVMDDAQPELLRRLDLNILLISELKRAGVMTEALSDALETKNLSRHEKISQLLESIRMGPVERFLCFCAVLHRCEQKHILVIMNVDVNSIKAQLDSLYGKPLVEELAEQGSYPGNLFPEQCEYYETKLALSPIYEYVSRSPLVHLDDMFTNLRLVNNEKDQGISKPSSKGEDAKPIQLRDIFDPKDKQVLSIIIEGRPGNGKSTLLRHSAVDWARRKKEKRDVKDFPLLDKDLLIFVDKNDEGETLDDTILNAIKGDRNTKKKSFDYMKTYPKRTFLFFDGLDEFLRETIRDEILKLAKDCGINIVVSCRLGHPYLENKMNFFNRHIRIEGFDPDSKETFVKSFMKVLSREKNDESLEQKSEMLSALLKEKDTQNVYTTPMNCTFLCILYAEGQVADEELSSLTMRDLYMRQQDLLLKREFTKTLYSNEQKSRESEEATIQGIYKMALHSLIHTEKQSRYSAEDAKKFGIDLNSPAMVMLQVEQDGPRKMLQWPHQIIKEFHAANAVKNRTIMYLIAAKEELNEVTSFVVSSLIKSDPRFVKELLTAALILRSTDPACSQSRFKQMFLRHACLEVPEVKQYLKEQDIEELLRKDSDDVSFVNNPDPVLIPRKDQIQACLKGGDWLIKNEDILQDLISIVQGCQSRLDCLKCLADAVHPFLPSYWSGYYREELDAELSGGVISSEMAISDRLHRRVSKIGCRYGVCLSPAAGSDIYCKITYTNPGLASKLNEWRNPKEKNDSDDNGNDDDDQFDVAKHNPIDMYMGNIKDAVADISHPFILQFSKKCGSVDFVRIYVEEDTGPVDIGRWTAVLTQLKAIFSPEIGIIIHDTKLTKDDMVRIEELLKINVRQKKW